MICTQTKVCKACELEKPLDAFWWRSKYGHDNKCKDCVRAIALTPQEGRFRCSCCRMWRPLEVKHPADKHTYCLKCAGKIQQRSAKRAEYKRIEKSRLNLSRSEPDGMERSEALKASDHTLARRIMSRVWGRAISKDEFVALMTCNQKEFLKHAPEMRAQAEMQRPKLHGGNTAQTNAA